MENYANMIKLHVQMYISRESYINSIVEYLYNGSTKYMYFQDVLIADETRRIKLNLWEDMIDSHRRQNLSI
jgi:benzoyl-CoA reductase/2-hydroxyglutaryl-CoA dehydratase subunit BcrC/BadD/HgdB